MISVGDSAPKSGAAGGADIDFDVCGRPEEQGLGAGC